MRLLTTFSFAAALVFATFYTAAAQDTTRTGLPLGPARIIEFSTDEGTWLSLDVSPDGETIIFELLGNLYTLPITGGEAERITSGMGFDSQPSFSPDGRWIAFVSDRDGGENLWIMRRDGSDARKLSNADDGLFASPEWMPAGDYVIVSQSTWGLRTYELWMYHVDGGTGVQITKAKPSGDTPTSQRHNALGVTVSPNGRFLYYAQKSGGFAYNVDFPLWQIARRDMETGEEDIITQSDGSAIRPIVSPDGTLLVYGTRHDGRTGLRLRNLETGVDRWLIYPVTRDDQESRFTRDLLPGYTFAPDGETIVMTFDGKLHEVSLADGGVRDIPFTADVSLEVGPSLYHPYAVDEGPVQARLIQDPTQSPDGDRIAFSALTKLYVMDLSGGPPRRVTSGTAHEFQPAWSPDGDWLAYVTWEGGEGQLWKVPADGGSAPQALTDVPAFYADPVWSPDGSRIVALRGSGHMRAAAGDEFSGPSIPMDIIHVSSDGGDVATVLPARGLGKPHFGDDSERIYVYDLGFEAGGGRGLISMRLDGTDRREHVKITGKGFYSHEEPVSAIEARISPDENWVLARVQNQLYVAAVPRVGGEAPTINVSSPTVPLKKLTDVGADYFGWADDGSTVTWAVGSTFFRRPLDSVTFDTTAVDTTAIDRFEATIQRTRAEPDGVVLLHDTRALTMRGDEIIERADILVEDNRIRAIGPVGSIDVPGNAQVIDLTGTTTVPGFVDTHAHWLEVRKGVLDVQNWSFLANVAFGVTSGLDVQTMTNDMFAYQDLVETGDILGPRAYSTGPGIFSNNAFSSVDDARGVLSRYRDHYRTRNLKSYVVGNRRQRQLVAIAAHDLGMMPTTEGALDLKLDLTHAIDGFSGSEHALPIVPLYKDVVELFAQTRMAYTPTLLVQYGGPWAENYFFTTMDVHDNEKLARFIPHDVLDAKTRKRDWFREDRYVFRETAEQAAKIVRAGGRVGVGSHGQLQGLGYHWELWALASGFTPMEALRAATLHGAEIIGIAQDLGSLEPGKLADLVVLDENPLEDIRHTAEIRYVMKNGELFDDETLTRIWPSHRELEPLWFWDEEPQVRAGATR